MAEAEAGLAAAAAGGGGGPGGGEGQVGRLDSARDMAREALQRRSASPPNPRAGSPPGARPRRKNPHVSCMPLGAAGVAQSWT